MAGTGNLLLKRGTTIPADAALPRGMPAAQLISPSPTLATDSTLAYLNYPNRLWMGMDGTQAANQEGASGSVSFTGAESGAGAQNSTSFYSETNLATVPNITAISIENDRPIWIGAEIRAYAAVDQTETPTGPYTILKADWNNPSDYVLVTQKAISYMPLRVIDSVSPGSEFRNYIEFAGWDTATNGDIDASYKIQFPASTTAPSAGEVLKVKGSPSGSGTTSDPYIIGLEWGVGGTAGGMTSFTFKGDTGTATVTDSEDVVVAGGIGLVSAATVSGSINTVTVDLDFNNLSTIALADADSFAFYDASGTTHGKVTADGLRDYVLGGVSGDITINSSGVATIAANSVELGTDTAGNYVADVTAGPGLTKTSSAVEGQTVDLAVGAGTGIAVNADNVALSFNTLSAVTPVDTDSFAFYDADGTTHARVTGANLKTYVLGGSTINASTVALTATNDTNATHYITFVDTATGNEDVRTDTGLTYNPSTNTLTATNFAGNATTTTTATLANNINISTTDGAAGDTSCYLTMVANSATGSQPVHIDSSLAYDATNNILTTTKIAATEIYRSNNTFYVTSGGGSGVVLSGLTTSPAAGTETRPTLTVDYAYNSSSLSPKYVSVAGGDLYLGTKTIEDGSSTSPVNIIFEGATPNSFKTTLTVVDPTAANTITLPNESGTVLVKDSNGDLLNKIRDMTITRDLTVTGNLQVDGTTTTINTTNLNVEDTIVTLNYGYTGSTASDSGIEIERGSLANVQMAWDESSKHWHAQIVDWNNAFGTTTAVIGHYPIILGDNTDPSTETKYTSSPTNAPAGTQYVHSLDIKNLTMSGTWTLNASISSPLILTDGGLRLPYTNGTYHGSNALSSLPEGQIAYNPSTNKAIINIGSTAGTDTSGTTQASIITTSNLTDITTTGALAAGSLASGFTPVTTTIGGTGLSSYTAGDMLYYSTGTALSKLAIGNNNYVLTSNGSAPVWTQNTGTNFVVRQTSPVITTPTIDSIVASATNATTDIHSAVTTGTISIGSGITSGSITIAGSTSLAGTVNIASGAISTGTKAINIGTGGTGGTTNINLGANTTGTAAINSQTFTASNATSITLSSTTTAPTINIGTGANTTGTKTISIGTLGGSGGSTQVTIGACASGHTSSVVEIGCPSSTTKKVYIQNKELTFGTSAGSNQISIAPASSITVASSTHSFPNITSGNVVIAGTSAFNNANTILMGGNGTTPSVYTDKDTVVVGGVRVNFQNTTATATRYPIPFLGNNRSTDTTDPTAGWSSTADGTYTDSYLYANYNGGTNTGGVTNYTSGLFYEVNDASNSNVGTLYCDYIGATLDCGTY